jgi:hypothetical protein
MATLLAVALLLPRLAWADDAIEKEDFAKYAAKLRESVIEHLQPVVIIQTANRQTSLGTSVYPWKQNIVTTIFWVGESASARNPVHNHSSCWELGWEAAYGGFDDPDPARRKNFAPAAFTPRENPFYFALPYNDVTRSVTRPEARLVIPWFAKAFTREGESVCHNRWIEIQNAHTRKVCYAQWSDCGPFRTDHWQYVFGNERPKPNLNQGAGLDVSPAVRDYLQLGNTDVTNWRFVEFREVPRGPWSQYGDNNTFVQQARGSVERVASATALRPPSAASSTPPTPPVEEPRVLLK